MDDTADDDDDVLRRILTREEMNLWRQCHEEADGGGGGGHQVERALLYAKLDLIRGVCAGQSSAESETQPPLVPTQLI